MSHLPHDASDDAILAFVNEWAALLAAEEYERAFAFTAHVRGCTLTPATFRAHVELMAHLHADCWEDSYGVLEPRYRVTLQGAPTHKSQKKEVERWPKNARGTVGQVWYDLNFGGFATDYTATFEIQDDGEGLAIALMDVGVH